MMHMNARELVTMAVQIERNGYEYYTKMSALTKNPQVKEILDFLAAEERKHVDDFTRIGTHIQDVDLEIPPAYQVPEIEKYLETLADGKVFSNLVPPHEIVREFHSDEDVIRHALSFEKDAIIYFSEILEFLPAGHADRVVVSELIRQEKIHMAKLYTILAQVQGKKI